MGFADCVIKSINICYIVVEVLVGNPFQSAFLTVIFGVATKAAFDAFHRNCYRPIQFQRNF